MRALGFEMRKVEVVDLLKRYGNEGLMEFDAFQKISTSSVPTDRDILHISSKSIMADPIPFQ